MQMRNLIISGITGLLILAFSLPLLQAQEFGRNKPRYRQFDFKVYKTPHFDIYHYFKNDQIIKNLADQSELWYRYQQSILKDTIYFKNPIIFFANHADFQQTNTISSSVGVTTGGVTEAFKNRVTMPVTFSNQKTFQVLGHELIHAFQFNMIINGDSTSIQNLANLPLYMVEGMAEYMTRGRIDPFTSMWMRDIVLNDKIPDLDKMANPIYFPYRYGQAFWSILTAKFGDEIMPILMGETAKYGMDISIPLVFGRGMDDLSEIWKVSLKDHFTKVMHRDKEDFLGKKLISDENGGDINISPSISPNGRYVIFLSEKGIFTTELFLADTRNGKIIRKIASTLRDLDLDNLDAFESSGTWSRDSKKYAFVAFSKGKNKIVIKNVENARDDDQFYVEDVYAINGPAWSPDNKYMVFSGLKDGQCDLFLINIKTRKVTQLTDDLYSEIQPQWNTEGTKILFSTDRLSVSGRQTTGPWYHNLAELDVASGAINDLKFFRLADNLNPLYDKNNDIWFLSDRDGYRNIYKYEVATDSLFQMTDFLTGVSGITPFSPAMSIARKSSRVVFTHYYDQKYTIYTARSSAFLRKPVSRTDVDKTAGTLPGPVNRPDDVNIGLATLNARETPDTAYFESEYKSKLRLDHISGSAGGGVSNGFYGSQTGLLGGAQLLFSDMLGDNTIGAFVSLNGELEDFGTSVSYINKKGRIQWGASLSHIPYRTGTAARTLDPSNANVEIFRTDLVRIFQDQFSLLGRLPINRIMRIDVTAATQYQYFGYTQYRDYYEIDAFGNRLFYLGSEREKVKLEGDEVIINGYRYNKGFVHSAGVALVGDNSYFGLASPMAGFRYRLGYTQYFGEYNYSTLIADARKYFWLKPISLGFRALHYARSGEDADTFFPIYISQQGLVRGLDVYGSSNSAFTRYGLNINQLIGSKLMMANAEIRLPFTGPAKIAAIPSKLLFTELAAFFDAGVAFDEYDQIEFASKRDDVLNLEPDKSVVLLTAGLSLRVNIFGAFILEPYYAIPIRENSKGEFGLNFLLPGW
jgi:Tol biopolymer transport system component